MKKASIAQLILEMTAFYRDNPRRIHHFLKVYALSKSIGESEGLDPVTLFTLEAAAVVHDIGIKPAEEKYQSSAWNLQEREGPPLAMDMLTRLGFEKGLCDRVTYLVSKHHTYDSIDGPDYQIMVEADLLVNIYERPMEAPAIASVRQKVFKTRTGLFLLDQMYPPAP